MSERSDGHDTRGLKRREFLSVGALPLAAALGAVKLGSPEKDGIDSIGSEHYSGRTDRSRRKRASCPDSRFSPDSGV